MATATAEKTTTTTTTDELLLTLADQSQPVGALLKANPKFEQALAVAWARGDVEFGRQSHCVTGRPGVPQSNPTLFIEDGIAWSGAKTPRHVRLAQLIADAQKVPECAHYRKYVKQVLAGKDEHGVEHWKTVATVPDGMEFRWNTETIQRPEAVALLALYVQLTDKGLSALQVA